MVRAGIVVDVVPEPRLEGSYRIGRRRRLGFAEYGAPAGRPLFWFHGTPGGRRQIPLGTRRAAERLGVRLIALERPGIGESTPHRYAAVVDWADDVGVVADRLGVDRFGCVGLSGGGPYALACAAKHPQRVVAAAVLGGVAPTQGPDAVAGGLVGLASYFRPLLGFAPAALGRAVHGLVRVIVPLRSQCFDLYTSITPEGDQRVLRRPDTKAVLLDDLVRACRRQAVAPVLDLLLFGSEWGFSLRDLTVPIRFWHGDADPIVPLAHAEHMAALVPDAELHVRPAESHLGAFDASDDAFAAILDLWPAPERPRRPAVG